MDFLLKNEKRRLLEVVLISLCVAWVVGTAWFAFQPETPINSYASYERQLANCKKLSSSQARYDCTSKLMLGKESTTFGKVVTILAPPLLLMIGYVSLRRLAWSWQDQTKRRAARDASQQRMTEWHNHVSKLKEEAAAANKGRAFVKTSLARPSLRARKQ